MVFYRKYRPQEIDELDNSAVRESLYSIFSKPSSIHAFLFTGPKGLGKTSAARIVAKVINCTKHKGVKSFKNEKDIEPDNKCQQCISITNGSNLDVLEIDGASNRGIDEIRDLRDKIRLAPFKAEKKIYIIDEVHMLTTEAFNALLKTLEEPPAHAAFILCTTEIQKVPETISSRCFRVNFTKATSEELTRSLGRIVKGEGIKIDKEALLEISNLSEGSFRDAAKILEEVSTFAGRKNITKDLVNEKYNTLGIGLSVAEMLTAFSEKNAKKALEICKKLALNGMDFKFFIQALIERLHFLLLVEVGVENSTEKSKLTLLEIQKLFELLTQAYQDTKYAVLPQAPLEIAVLEWVGEMSAEVDEGPVAPSSRPMSSVASSLRALDGTPPGRATLQNSTFSDDLIKEVKIHNNLFAGILRSCKVDLNGSKLTIVASSKFHKEKIEENKNLKILEDATKKLTGKNVKIDISLGGEAK